MLSAVAHWVWFLGCIVLLPFSFLSIGFSSPRLPLSFTFFLCVPLLRQGLTQRRLALSLMWVSFLYWDYRCAHLFWFVFLSLWQNTLTKSIMEESQGKNLSKSHSRTLPCDEQHSASSLTQSSRPRGLGLPVSISNQDSALARWRQSFTGGLLSLGDLRCIMLLIKTNQHTIPSCISISWVWVTSLP